LQATPEKKNISGTSWMTQEHYTMEQQAIKDATTHFYKDFYEVKTQTTLQEQVDVA
jgi:predicted NAD-dependent protein-ADP-ribosyltransferase YbiA (DUF1768 family)